jgi:hypothetical protein
VMPEARGFDGRRGTSRVGCVGCVPVNSMPSCNGNSGATPTVA